MPRAWAEAQLRRMMQAVCHQPSYQSGVGMEESLGIYVGWTALPGSFSDCLPLHNERGDVILFFSGEEYPDPECGKRLMARGHECGVSGASGLPHRYEEDPEFLRGLNGRFHGLLVDRTRGTVRLFNDRYGLHRLVYHQSREAFYFAAEAKAILAVCPAARTVDPRSLGEFVACGCVMENRTLFAGVQALPPASDWTLQGAEAQPGSYFQPKEWEAQPEAEAKVWYQELREAFSRNLPRYFQGPQKIGMSLTGGLDTRMIMAWQKCPAGSLPCYSFAGMYRDCQDVILARKIARLCGQPYERIPVGTEFLSRFASYAERTVFLTDGCAEVNRAADLYVNERACQIAPVRMTGNYGSEVLRWAPAFKPAEPDANLYHPDLLPWIRMAGETYAAYRCGHPVSFAVFRQAPWYHYGLLALEQTQISVRTPFLDNDFVCAAFRAPNPALAARDAANMDLCLQIIADGSTALRSLRTDRGAGGSRGHLLSMAARCLLGFTFKAEYAYDYGMPQWVSRVDHALAPLHLERLFLGRHKFTHYRVWYRDALSRYVREMLLDARSLARPYLQRAAVEAVVRGHLERGRNYTTAIHQLLTLELVHRLFVDAQ
jgi:asparagine synthase (glutamine-hydrolysing)